MKELLELFTMTINHLLKIYLGISYRYSFAIEIYKIKNNMSTPMMSELFEKHDLNYDLRPKRDFSLHSVNAVAYGLK